ncbi:Transposon TX1 uncharacterized 149 kDa protein ORF 2 [Takifugu flavidus]|uniref:Transposon TX1 uncharacterized 149 kDa protein ORF 2 n=1 Tax=Takifugu flavidus TaxID=433684 RepID=A0A5C6MWA1_9TELE|nr:Transposon TX1 uncharacterized 149 kDa protein ORF 2 [Takifugu flavidus]
MLHEQRMEEAAAHARQAAEAQARAITALTAQLQQLTSTLSSPEATVSAPAPPPPAPVPALCRLKKVDVLLIQETHSNGNNEGDWRREWPGQVFLSHKLSNSAGVGILFSPHFKPQSAELHHIMDGHVLMVKAVYENVKLVFLCVYAPVLSRDRMNCLNVLCNVVRGVQDEFLFMGGDFNCTVDARLDRNHLEPHPASSARLKRLLETYDLKDVWRGFNNATRQYTWAHCWDNSMSLARLDRLYCFKHHLSIFKNCHIVPVGVSDHSLLKCEFFIQNVKTSSAYWHFNTALLEDHAFRQALQVLWDAHRLRKPMFSSLHRWWDFGKTVTQQFCQQYTRNVTKHITRSLQDLETEVQNLLGCTENRGYVEVLQSKNAAIASLLGTTAQGALVCSRYMNASMMDAPSKFFFSLEQKNGQKKVIHCLRADDSSDITNTARIRRHATCFYKELFKSYAVENPGLETEFLTDLSQVGESSNTLLSADLTLEELYVALMSLANGKAPGIDGIPVEFYKAFWSVVGKDMLEVFLESWRTGLLPRSCRRAIITLLPKKGDLQDLKNWRPVFLLCGDYKILSKALAIRLREAMAEVIHVDQTYCVPGRRIKGGLQWTTEGLKYLGVFLGNDESLKKNWEGVLEAVEGRLKRLAVVDPPADLLSRVQTVIVDFLWDRLHWLPQVVLFLPKEEGGQGLVHLASKRAVFSEHGSCCGNRANHQSSFWGETVIHGSLLSPPSWAGATVPEALCTAGVATLGALREATGPDLKETTELQVRLGWRSKRNVKRLLSHWRACLTERERQMLREHSQRMTSPCPEHPFPSLVMRPGPDQQLEVTLETAESKALSRLMVRGLNRQRLERRSRSPWRAKLTLGEEVRPEWKSFYKPPLSKKAADLQWRLVYGVLAVNKFVSILNPSVTGTCPFCEAVETIVHCFAECPRLLPLFSLLEALFRRAGEAFSLRTFVYGFKYTKAKKDKCHLMNFILGQSKMAVYISRRRKVEDSVDCDVVLLLSRRIKARILIDFHFYRKMEDLEQFVRTWTYGGILCSIQLEDLVFSDQLV